ncbi:MAG: LPS-assembly protein LptD [Rhodospirillales bacterium]
MRALRVVAVALAVAVACGAPRDGQAQIRQDRPVHFKADTVSVDRERRTVHAQGHVEIWQGERILIADDLRFDERSNMITATGNVALLEPSSEVLFADRMEITGDLRDGVAADLRIRLADNARIAAVGGRRVGGTRTEMRKAVYSRCEACPDDPERAPVWQVKAAKVTHDSEAKEVEYEDAVLEMFGVPVLYAPYFSHPDPTVKRRSGFLSPTFGNDSLLGQWIRTPYYYEIAQNRDLLVEPMFTVEENALLAAQYRHRFAHGYLDMTGSFTYASGESGDDEFRGHLQGFLRYDIDDTWRGGFDMSLASDDTFRRRYRFGSEQTLVNRAYVEGFRGRTYASANAYYFQGVRQEDDQGRIPFVMPYLTYNFVGQPDRLGGRWAVDANLLMLTRTDGADSRRLSLRTGWERPFTSRFGEIYTLSAGVQSDAYLVDDVTPTGKTESESGFAGRVFPHIAADWRLPLVRAGSDSMQMIEPVAGLIVAPTFGNPDRIPNEDSLDFDLNDFNISSANLYGGHDRIAPGPRTYYGFRTGWYADSGRSITTFLAQSYRFTDQDDDYDPGSGFDERLSDVVGRIDFALWRNVDTFYRFRLDKDDLTPRRHEIAARIGPPAFSVAADYLRLAPGVADPEFDREREELLLFASSRITQHWTVSGRARQDIAEDRHLSHGARLTYEDECVYLIFDYSRTYTSDRDIEPRSSFTVRLTLKTLGSLGLGGEI